MNGTIRKIQLSIFAKLEVCHQDRQPSLTNTSTGNTSLVIQIFEYQNQKLKSFDKLLIQFKIQILKTYVVVQKIVNRIKQRACHFKSVFDSFSTFHLYFSSKCVTNVVKCVFVNIRLSLFQCQVRYKKLHTSEKFFEREVVK